MDIILYAALAVFIAYKLYLVLGQHHEGDDVRYPPDRTRLQNQAQEAARDKARDLLPLPATLLRPQPENPPGSTNHGNEPAAQSLAGGLLAIEKADPQFNEKTFLKGARAAFSIIVHAFAAAERGVLQNLLSPQLYRHFDAALSARAQAQHQWEMKVLEVRDAEIVRAQLQDKDAVITVQFVSDQSKIIRDTQGQLVSDPGRMVEQFTDRWVFSRNTTSPNPNWTLLETHSV